MRDLSEVLAAQAGRQQPSGRPEFADLLARRHRRQWHRRVACAATLGCTAAAVAALAVAGGLSPPPAPRGNVLLSGPGVASPAPEVMLTRDYAVTPTGPPPASEAAALPWRCSSLPGVWAGGVLPLSDPPHYLFQVHGTAAQVARFEQCLAALPDTRVEMQTPGPSVPPATPPTTQGCAGFALTFSTNGAGGAVSPEQAAQVHAAAANGQPFPMPSIGWRPDGDDTGGVYVRSGDVRLHTIRYPDGTWTVDTGRNCS